MCNFVKKNYVGTINGRMVQKITQRASKKNCEICASVTTLLACNQVRGQDNVLEQYVSAWNYSGVGECCALGRGGQGTRYSCPTDDINILGPQGVPPLNYVLCNLSFLS